MAARVRVFLSLRAWREVPLLVALSDADNVLPVDLDNALSVESFVQLVKEREEATLQEIFPGPEQLCALGPEGRFVHELIVPFVKSKDVAERIKGETRQRSGVRGPESEENLSSLILPPSFVRRFPPGSEWLYAKLYTGTATADRVLCEILRLLVEQMINTGAVDQWFFIRYGDPEWHLSLRFHG